MHWLQFADDATVITTVENDIQLLLNCFIRWRQWVNTTIRVDKCTIFGIKKFSTRSLQFQPSLLLNHAPVPAVKQGESFRNLGSYFDFATSNQAQKPISKWYFSVKIPLEEDRRELRKIVWQCAISSKEESYLDRTGFWRVLCYSRWHY